MTSQGWQGIDVPEAIRVASQFADPGSPHFHTCLASAVKTQVRALPEGVMRVPFRPSADPRINIRVKTAVREAFVGTISFDTVTHCGNA